MHYSIIKVLQREYGLTEKQAEEVESAGKIRYRVHLHSTALRTPEYRVGRGQSASRYFYAGMWYLLQEQQKRSTTKVFLIEEIHQQIYNLPKQIEY